MPVAVAAGNVSSGDAAVSYSTDGGATWTYVPNPGIPVEVFALIWVQEFELFIAGTSGGRIYTSPDAITWTHQVSIPTLAGATFTGFAWAASLGLLVGVLNNGSVATSPDGITWTDQGDKGNSLNTVSWSPELGLFVAAGVTELKTSPDAVTWTNRTTGWSVGDAFRGSAWSPSLGLFVAAGFQTDGSLRTSPDGITWTSRPSAFGATDVYGVEWSEFLGMFVLVGGAGKLATSTDGVTFTLQTSSFGSTIILDVAWDPRSKTFIAGGYGNVGGSGKVAMSTDGITWTQQVSNFPINDRINAVASNGQPLGEFIQTWSVMSKIL